MDILRAQLEQRQFHSDFTAEPLAGNAVKHYHTDQFNPDKQILGSIEIVRPNGVLHIDADVWANMLETANNWQAIVNATDDTEVE